MSFSFVIKVIAPSGERNTICYTLFNEDSASSVNYLQDLSIKKIEIKITNRSNAI